MEWTPEEQKHLDHIERHLTDLRASLFQRGKWRYTHQVDDIRWELQKLEQTRLDSLALEAAIADGSWKERRLEAMVEKMDGQKARQDWSA